MNEKTFWVTGYYTNSTIGGLNSVTTTSTTSTTDNVTISPEDNYWGGILFTTKVFWPDPPKKSKTLSFETNGVKHKHPLTNIFI